MTQLPVKDVIIEFFRRQNIGHIFHLPGIHTLPLNQAFEISDISVFEGRHESGCAFMADGYARASGQVGVIVVTPGPGLGNIVAPCIEALGDGVPLLVVHIDSDPKGWGRGVLHEVVNPETIFSNVTKATFSVRKAEGVLPTLEAAYRSAATERCGPVVVSIPHTLLEKRVSLNLSEFRPQHGLKPAPCDTSGLERALSGKKRPVIIGGRALVRSGLGRGIKDLCGDARIPFLTTTSGKGLVSEDLPFVFGNIIGHGVPRAILSQADTVIAMGTRLRDADAKRRGVKLKDIIHIDVDDQWMGKNYSTAIKIVCPDFSWAVDELSRIFTDSRWEWDIDALRAEQERERKELLAFPGYAITNLLRSAIPRNTMTVWDLNLISYWAEYYFPVFEEGAFITPRGTSPIFYAVPAALGAKIARPELPCLCVTGDGSFLPTLSELATAKKHAIPVVFLVYNNSSYGVLDEYMAKRYGLSDTMSLYNPDFVMLARSFDIKAVKVDTLDGLAQVLQQETTWTEPFLIEFDYPIFPPPWQI